jgi:hypothetical protein
MIRAYRPFLEEMPVERIAVGFRRRQSVGDLTSLMRSIERVGLLNPIIVTERGRLVIGWRRLEAFVCCAAVRSRLIGFQPSCQPIRSPNGIWRRTRSESSRKRSAPARLASPGAGPINPHPTEGRSVAKSSVAPLSPQRAISEEIHRWLGGGAAKPPRRRVGTPDALPRSSRRRLGGCDRLLFLLARDVDKGADVMGGAEHFLRAKTVALWRP